MIHKMRIKIKITILDEIHVIEIKEIENLQFKRVDSVLITFRTRIGAHETTRLITTPTIPVGMYQVP